MAEFPIRVTVRAVPEEDIFLDVVPPVREVDKGMVATFAVTVSGEHPGGIDLSIVNAPEGAVVRFGQENPVFSGDTVELTVETANLPNVTTDYNMVVRALAAAV